MSAQTGNLTQLIDRPLQPLRPEWTVSERVEALRAARAMPKTRTGKIMRRLLRDLVMHGRPTGDTSAMEDSAVLDVVAAAVRS